MDLWDVALIVNQDELIRLVGSVKHVRTQIKGYENELIGIIVRSDLLGKVKLSDDDHIPARLVIA